ncbi:MAG: hypothetical protein KDB79_14365 [Acidobacteria bacterium]|nr:hypothetical protein [Acidobacteriota bacterium]
MKKNKRITLILMIAASILLVPFVAMKFTNEVNWTGFDFIVAGALLFGAGIAIEIVLRAIKKTAHRLAFCAAILAAVLLIWIELAVGIFGTPFGGS